MKNKILILMLGMILLIGIVSAFVTNTFSNNFTNESLFFTDSYNITRYLSVPQNIIITNAFINLTGSYLSYDLNTDPSGSTGQGLSNTSSIFSSNIKGQNVSILNKTIDKISWRWRCASNCDGNISYGVRFASNRSLITSCDMGSANVSASFSYRECDFVNFNTGNNNVVYTIELTAPANTTSSIEFTGEGVSANQSAHGANVFWGLQWEYFQSRFPPEWSFTSDTSNIGRYYNMNFTFADGRNFIYSENPSIYINGLAYTSPGELNTTITTSNLGLYISNYLSSCSYVNGTCNVPITFFSSTGGNITYSNMVFSNEVVQEISNNYSANAYETSHETFTTTILYDSTTFPFINGILNYNGTNYTGVKTGSGNNATFTANLDIPLVTSGESELRNFSWTIIITNSTGTPFVTITPTQIQNVSRIHFTPCGTYNTTAVNFTAYKESNLTRIDPFLFQGTFNVWLGNGNIKRTETINNITVSEMPICIFPTNKQYNTTAEIAYDGATAGQFIPRNYHYNMHIFNSVAQQVPLFLLQPSESTSFILFVRDQNLQAVSGALVFTERYYPGTNTYETVQVGKTGDGGKTVGFFVTETVDYRFRVFVNGEEQLLTTKQKIVGETAPFTITLTIGIQPDNPLVRFDELSQFTGVLQYDNATQLVTFTYQDFTGNLTKARLYVEKINSGTPNTVICNITSSALASTLSCDVSGYPEGTFLAQAFVARSPEFLTKAIQFIKNQIQSIFGNTGLFLAWFLILTAAMVMIWNPTVGIITTNAIIILVNIIGLASFPPLVIFSLIALSVTIIILMKT